MCGVGGGWTAYGRDFDRASVKGQEPRGFPLSPPRGSWVARCLGAVEDRLSERSASCRPKLTMSRVAGRSEANCRISISVAFLPQKIAPAAAARTESGRKHYLGFGNSGASRPIPQPA